MLLLLFVVFLIQFFTFWIFEPLTTFLTYFLEVRFLPVLVLLIFIYFFSSNSN